MTSAEEQIHDRKLADSLARIELDIEKDTRARDRFRTWSNRVGIAALTCVALFVAPPLKVAALVGGMTLGLGFVGLKILQSARESRINAHYETQASVIVAAEATRKMRQPENDIGQKAGPDFDNAARLDDLEKAVEVLEKKVDIKPVPLHKPKF